MNTWTRIGLILLRIVIGWHFLFEGLDKLESTWHHQGRLLFPTLESAALERIFGESKELQDGKAAWSAEPYLRESQGPLASWFREQAGDLDAQAQAKLTLPEGEPGKLPAPTESEWDDKIQRFTIYYGFGNDKAVQPEFVGALAASPLAPFPAVVPWPALARGQRVGTVEQLQKTLAEEDFQLARKRAVDWLQAGTRQVPSKLPSVAEKVIETTPERIALHRKKLNELRDIEEKGMPAFNQDAWKDNYRLLKKEIATLRTELLRDLDKPFNDAMSVARFRLSKTQRKHELDNGPVPPATVATTNLDRINFVTRWGVALVGICLLLGLFTRTSCVAGVGFLLMFYLAMPALPWLPANPRAEGHYLYINKNIIEMVALLTLATTRSGKWFGLDGFVQFMSPFRWRRKAPARRTQPRPQPVA